MFKFFRPKPKQESEPLLSPAISPDLAVPEAPSPYVFVEPAIRSVWTKGALEHITGSIEKAVIHWTAAMKLQASLAETAGIDPAIRVIPQVWICNIGHIACIDIFAKAKALGLIDTKKFIVLANDLIANPSYLAYFAADPLFEILYDSEAVAKLDINLKTEIPGVMKIGDEWLWLNLAIGVVQQKWNAENRPPLFTLRQDHAEAGWRLLESWGVPKDAWFVTMHIRESGLAVGGFSTDSIRNVEVMDYVEAIKLITAAGGYVMRIGGSHYTPLPDLPNVIDYATQKPQEDWIDVFLLAQARFMIATNSGPAWVSNTFGVPILFTNWAPRGVNPFWEGASVLYKRVYTLATGVDLPEAQQFAEPISQLESLAALEKLGYGVHPNTSDEIAAAVEKFIEKYAPSKIKTDS